MLRTTEGRLSGARVLRSQSFRGIIVRHTFNETLRRSGHDTRLLRPILIVDSAHAGVQYVRAGLGLSIAARRCPGCSGTSGVAGIFDPWRTCRSEFFCIANSRHEPFPVVPVFLEYLQNNTRHLRSGKYRDVHGDGETFAPQPR